jgi:membrane protease YdiL (CAAX protease family)
MEYVADSGGRLLGRRAGVLVAIAIGLGGVMQLVAVALSRSASIDPEALIRYDIVLTIGLYAVVGAMIVSQVTPAVRLRWGNGPLVVRVGVGLASGVTLSLVLLTLVSLAVGHVQPDPRLVVMMSEGDPTHIGVTVFLACIAAPLVEETLFRGLLLESLRPRGTRVAIVVSATAFAVWHLMPSSLVYYAGLGAGLGTLYLKRGLAGSIAAHVGFNGVLVIAAISVVLGPSHVVTVGTLSLDVPGGWSVDSAPTQPPTPGVVLSGPSDAELDVIPAAPTPDLSAALVATRLRSGAFTLPPGLVFDGGAVTERPVGSGVLVEVPFTVNGVTGTFAILGTSTASYDLSFVSGGSPRASDDFARMLGSLRLS